MKRYRVRVKSRLRFSIFLILIFIVMFSILSSVVASDDSRPSWTSVYVEEGDTLWDIARENLPPNTDIRKYIYEIKQLNSMKEALIKPGQEIKIPIH